MSRFTDIYTPPHYRDRKGDDEYLSAYRKAYIAIEMGEDRVNLTWAEMHNCGRDAVELAAKDPGKPQPEIKSIVPKIEKTMARAKVAAFCGAALLGLGISLKVVFMWDAFLGHPLESKDKAPEHKGKVTNDYSAEQITDIERIADNACEQEPSLPANTYQQTESTYTITQNLEKASLQEAGATVVVAENVSVDELYVCGASTEILIDGSVDTLGVLGAGAEVTVSGAAEHVSVLGASTTLSIEGWTHAATIRGGNASATVSGVLEHEIICEYIGSPFSVKGDGAIHYTTEIAA